MLAKVLKYSKELDKSIEQIAKRQFCRWCLVGGADPSNVPPLAPTSPHHTFLGGIPVNLLVEVSLSLEPKRAARAHHPLPQPFADEAVNAFSTTIIWVPDRIADPKFTRRRTTPRVDALGDLGVAFHLASIE